MKHLFAILVLMLAFAACSTDKIDTWDAKPCVWFTEARDTLIFSFYSQPGENDYTIEIPISMAGRIADADRAVAVRDLGALNPETDYEIVSANIPAGETEGVVSVNVRKTENLNTANDTITIGLIASDVFELGLDTTYWQNTIVVSNTLSKPSWWDSDAERNVGYYSDLKMEIIYTVLGSDEIFSSGSSWASDEVIIAIYNLNRYCIDNNIKYNPEDETVVQFDFWTN